MAGLPLQNTTLQTVMLTGNPALTQNPDNQPAAVMGGRHGETLVSRIHGDGYVARARGNGFVGSFLVGVGSALKIAAQTTGVAVLYNPVGSGVIVDLEQISIATATVATTVISGIALEGSLQTPSGTLTQATVTSFPMGAARGAPVAKVYQAPTIVAMTYICNVGLSIAATTSTGSGVFVRDFGGRMLLAPGFSVNLISNITQGANLMCIDYFWSEWPV